MVCGGAFALAFVGGSAATRLHYKCRPRLQGCERGQTTADSPFLGVVWGPRTLRNAEERTGERDCDDSACRWASIAGVVAAFGAGGAVSVEVERAGLRGADRPRRAEPLRSAVVSPVRGG